MLPAPAATARSCRRPLLLPAARCRPQLGGLGFVHYNNTLEAQLNHVLRVKTHVPGFVTEPIVMGPAATVGDLHALKVRRPLALLALLALLSSSSLARLRSCLPFVCSLHRSWALHARLSRGLCCAPLPCLPPPHPACPR